MADEQDDYEEAEYDNDDDDNDDADDQLPQFDENGNMRSFPAPQIAEPNAEGMYLSAADRREIAEKLGAIEEKAHYYAVGMSIDEIITIIGDDPTREGLRETANRVIRSWDELYSGYTVDIAGMFTVFEPEQYDEMVILKNVHFTSMCEHHMLPFSGVAHVAYLPNKKLVGVSKLARVVDAYSRRLQNQERIASQVTAALMEYLQPHGAACVLEGKHFCMSCRGVKQSEATMVTSSLDGVFKYNQATRAEFFSLIKGG